MEHNTSKHEEKRCQRCSADFICKVGDASNCQCSEVSVSQQTQAFIATTFYDCLCKNCLADLNRLLRASRLHTFPKQKELMLEGIHFYRENNCWVFTELYHVLRGHCCQNGCRHCAYGYNN